MQRLLEVSDPSQVGAARRAAARLARDCGFGEGDEGRVAIAITEAAGNLLKHGGGGHIVLAPMEEGGVRGLEMLVLDRGPGLGDLGRSMSDGYSTIGTLGVGLGAIARQSSLLDVYSSPERGTALAVHFWPGGRVPARTPVAFGAVSLPKLADDRCGDAWTRAEEDDRTTVLVVDGVGHGVQAAEAADAAVAAFRAHAAAALPEIMQRMHEALRSTRGAAAGLARLDRRARMARFCGVGNIGASILAGDTLRHLVSHHGTLGHEVHAVREFEYPWPAGAHLVLHSDGILSHWNLAGYAGLLERHPLLVAGILYRDFRRGHDDATVVVTREAA